MLNFRYINGPHLKRKALIFAFAKPRVFPVRPPAHPPGLSQRNVWGIEPRVKREQVIFYGKDLMEKYV
jgi:hypothetical protein